MFNVISVLEMESIEESNSFLQSNFWATFKSIHGWEKRFFSFKCIYKNTQMTLEVATLSRNIKMFGSLLYIPMLPNIEKDLTKCIEAKNSDENTNIIEDIEKLRKLFLAKIAKSLFDLLGKDIFIIRFDPSWQVEVENAGGKAKEMTYSRPKIEMGKCEKVILKKARVDIQPPDTVLLDITLSEDELTSQFKSKWRYNIRLSEKKGCIVEAMPMNSETEIEEGINIFYSKFFTKSMQTHTSKVFTVIHVDLSR